MNPTTQLQTLPRLLSSTMTRPVVGRITSLRATAGSTGRCPAKLLRMGLLSGRPPVHRYLLAAVTQAEGAGAGRGAQGAVGGVLVTERELQGFGKLAIERQ